MQVSCQVPVFASDSMMSLVSCVPSCSMALLEEVPSSLSEAGFTDLVVQRVVDRGITGSAVIVNRVV